MQFLSLYLHIPFCRARCSYCAFNIYTDRQHLIQKYVEALCREIQLLGNQQPVHTIYFGGGTPSLLQIPQIAAILAAINRAFDVQPNPEITLEANPENLPADYLAGLVEVGINRLSLGMQSAHSHELALFGRQHQMAETVTAIERAQAAGLQNISLDLIYGIPQQSLDDWRVSLQSAVSLNPAHFSLYALQLENGTELKRQVKYGQLPKPDDDLTADMYHVANQTLTAQDYQHYEISTWGKQASRHNLQYWYNLPYLGLGAGAHGFANGMRTVNTMRPEVYIKRISATDAADYPTTNATQSAERVSHSQERFETIMVGLRLLQEGFSIPAFESRFDVDFMARYGVIVERFVQQNLLRFDGSHLWLTPSAFFIANHVLEAFLLDD